MPKLEDSMVRALDLSSFFRELTPEDRRLLVLRRLMGCTFDEAARCLGRSASWTSRRYRRLCDWTVAVLSFYDSQTLAVLHAVAETKRPQGVS